MAAKKKISQKKKVKSHEKGIVGISIVAILALVLGFQVIKQNPTRLVLAQQQIATNWQTACQ